MTTGTEISALVRYLKYQYTVATSCTRIILRLDAYHYKYPTHRLEQSERVIPSLNSILQNKMCVITHKLSSTRILVTFAYLTSLHYHHS